METLKILYLISLIALITLVVQTHSYCYQIEKDFKLRNLQYLESDLVIIPLTNTLSAKTILYVDDDNDFMQIEILTKGINNALNGQCSFGTTWYENGTKTLLSCFNDVHLVPSLLAAGVEKSSSMIAPVIEISCLGAKGFNQWCEGSLIVQITNETVVNDQQCTNSTVRMPPCELYSCPLSWTTI